MSMLRRCDHPRHDPPVVIDNGPSQGFPPQGWSQFQLSREQPYRDLCLDLCPDCTVRIKVVLGMTDELIPVAEDMKQHG